MIQITEQEIMERGILLGQTIPQINKILLRAYPATKLQAGNVKFCALQMSRNGYITDEEAKRYCAEVVRTPKAAKAPAAAPAKALAKAPVVAKEDKKPAPVKEDTTEAKAPALRRRGRPGKKA